VHIAISRKRKEMKEKGRRIRSLRQNIQENQKKKRK